MKLKYMVFAAATLLFSLIFSQSAAYAYPGGLLQGEQMTRNNGTKTTVITDGNTATGAEGMTGSSWSYTFPTTVDLTSVRIHVSGDNTSFTAYNEAGGVVGTYLSAAGDRTVTVNYKNVKRVVVAISYTSGWPRTFFEMDVFGQYNLSRPIDVKAVAGEEKIDVSYTPASGSESSWIYVDDVKYKQLPPEQTTYRIDGLTADKAYKIAMTAVHGGIESQQTAYIMSTPISGPLKTTIAATSKANSFTLTWPGASGARYLPFVNGKIGVTNNGDYQISPWTKAAEPDTEYEVYLKVFDKYGRESVSNTVTIKTKPDEVPPGSPIVRAEMNGNNSAILVYWTGPADKDVAGYRIWAKKDGGEYAPLSGVVGSPYTFKNPEAPKKYTFKMTAYDKSGNESEPAETSIVAAANSTETETEMNNEFLLVEWTEIRNATGYVIKLNGREVGRVSKDVLSYKITRAMGYMPGALINRADVTAIYADGSQSDPSNSGGGAGGGTGGGAGGGNALENALSFIGVKDMFEVAISFLGIYSKYIVLVFAVVFSPALYGWLIRLIAYLRRREDVTYRQVK